MKREITRRGFLGGLGRLAGLAGLGGLVARLAGRPPGRAGETVASSLCRRCRALRYCNLPEGVRTRREEELAEEDLRAFLLRQHSRSDVRGLCGRRAGAPGFRWVRRETT